MNAKFFYFDGHLHFFCLNVQVYIQLMEMWLITTLSFQLGKSLQTVQFDHSCFKIRLQKRRLSPVVVGRHIGCGDQLFLPDDEEYVAIQVPATHLALLWSLTDLWEHQHVVERGD